MLNGIYDAYLVTLSSPVKPGTIHRLIKDPEFELRLLEFVTIQEFIDSAFKRGYMLGRGDIDSKHLGIGKYIADALKKSLERTGIRPLTGMIASSITLASLLGYHTATQSKKSFEETIRKSVATILYSTNPEETIAILEGLEAIGDSDLILHLDNRGITKRKITLNTITLGDFYEILAEIDTGFLLNLKTLNTALSLATDAKKSSTFIGAVVETYVKLADKAGYFSMEQIVKSKNPLSELSKLDSKIVERQKYNRLLGGTFLAVAIANIDLPLRIPVR